MWDITPLSSLEFSFYAIPGSAALKSSQRRAARRLASDRMRVDLAVVRTEECPRRPTPPQWHTIGQQVRP